jgi:dsDNA-binding SOS-regulon protein
MSKKKENRYNKMCDKFDTLDKRLEDMYKSIREIKEQCETSEIDIEDVDPLGDFEDLLFPELNGVKK